MLSLLKSDREQNVTLRSNLMIYLLSHSRSREHAVTAQDILCTHCLYTLATVRTGFLSFMFKNWLVKAFLNLFCNYLYYFWISVFKISKCTNKYIFLSVWIHNFQILIMISYTVIDRCDSLSVDGAGSVNFFRSRMRNELLPRFMVSF